MDSFYSECRIILGCMYYGFVIALIYNFVIVIRSHFKRHYVLEYVLDIAVGIVLGVCIFMLIYENNNGNLRLYYIITVGIGSMIYVKIFSKSVSSLLRNIKIIKMKNKLLKK